MLKRAIESKDEIRAELQNVINLGDEYGDKPIDDAIDFNQTDVVQRKSSIL